VLAYLRSWLIGIVIVLAALAVDSLLDGLDAQIGRCSTVHCT
jgi:hypothetical protein